MISSRWSIAAVVLLFSSCAFCKVMTPCVFENAQVGDSIEEVIQCGGQPYYIGQCKTKGLQEYIYVSRQELAEEMFEHRNWVFVVNEDGMIVNKWVCNDNYFDLLNRDAPGTER